VEKSHQMRPLKRATYNPVSPIDGTQLEANIHLSSAFRHPVRLQNLLPSSAQQEPRMFRQRTDPALARARAAQRAPTLPSQASPGRVQDWYPAYANFPWENIERFLRQKWPYWTDFNPSKVCKPSSMITNTYDMSRRPISGNSRCLKG
jgi:hypothetical protein